MAEPSAADQRLGEHTYQRSSRRQEEWSIRTRRRHRRSARASFVSGCQSGVLFVCLLACLLHQVSPRSSCSTVFVVVALARARLAFGGGVYAHFWLITRAGSGCAVRCFRGLLRWRVLVALIKKTGVFLPGQRSLRPLSPLRPLRPPRPLRPDARTRTRTRTPAKCPLSWWYTDTNPGKWAAVWCPSGTVSRFGAFPVAFAVLDLATTTDHRRRRPQSPARACITAADRQWPP